MRRLRAGCGSGERSLRVRLHEACCYSGAGICSALSDLILDLIGYFMMSASLYRYLPLLLYVLMHTQYLRDEWSTSCLSLTLLLCMEFQRPSEGF